MRPPPARPLLIIPIVAACAALIAGGATWLLRSPYAASRGVASRTAVGPKTPAVGAGGAGTFEVKPAPAFALTVLSPGAGPAESAGGPEHGRPVIPHAGRPLALAALRGHPVVVNFWASWCAPCREEIPLLVKTAHAYAAQGVVVLGLDVDDTPADAKKFLAAYHVDYPILTVTDNRLTRAYGVYGLPTTVFVDAAGQIRARQVGGFVGPDGTETLRHRVEALLAANPR